jgi:carbamoyl-phosphate synthase large subunit
LTYSLKQADDYIITPLIQSTEYIDFLLAYCKEKSVNVLISLFDIDLPILSKNIDKFENIGVTAIVSSEKAVDICNDKWKTFQFLLSIGLKQPKTYISIRKCKEDLSLGKLKFPLIIKPRWGMGSIGIFEIDNAEELDVLYKKLHKTILSSYLNFESNQDIDACILIQQKIIGKEFGLDILNDLNGVYVTTIVKQKLAMRAGETDIAQVVDNSMFLKTSTKIAESLAHIGNLDVDCFVTADGGIYVLEMNCRFGGHYPFSHLSGVDFPAQIVRWCCNEKTDEKLLRFTDGILMTKDLVPVII